MFCTSKKEVFNISNHSFLFFSLIYFKSWAPYTETPDSPDINKQTYGGGCQAPVDEISSQSDGLSVQSFIDFFSGTEDFEFPEE